MNAHGYVVAIAAALICLPTAAFGADSDDDVVFELDADLVTIGPNGATSAFGHVELDAGDIRLESASLLLSPDGIAILPPPFRIEAGKMLLTGARGEYDPSKNTLLIDEPRLRLDGSAPLSLRGRRLVCMAGACRLEKGAGTACPHHPTGYRILADEITLHESGDVDIDRPVLVVGETPVAILPWIRIRPPTKPGFLAPRLRWDREGGLVAGPAGHLPIADDVYAQGHVAARTAQGLEASSVLHSASTEARVDYLLDTPRSHGRLRLEASPPLDEANLALDLDLVDGRTIVDDLASRPLDRAVTHTSSHALVSAGSADVIVETSAALTQGLGVSGDDLANGIVPVVGIALSIPPFPTLTPLWPTLDLSMRRVDIQSRQYLPDAGGLLAPAHTLFAISPGLVLNRSLSPLAARLRAHGDHRAWLTDGADADPSRTSILAEARIELPIVGFPAGARHLLVPFVAYRIVPWIRGSSPGWSFDGLDSLRTAHGIEGGVQTSLARGAEDLLLAELTMRVDLPGLGADTSLAYSFARLAFGPLWARIAATGSWDPDKALFSHASVSLSSSGPGGSLMELGGTWYAPGRGAHQDGRWVGTSLPLVSSRFQPEARRALELFDHIRVPFTRTVHGIAGARIGVIPSPALNALWYGVEIGPPCGCILVGVTASHRPDSAVPDVMTTLTLAST